LELCEAINGLQKVKKGLFKPNIFEGTRPTIKVLGFDTIESLKAKSDVQDLHIVPAFSGGKSGWVSILVGAVLIAAAFIPGVGEAIAGATFGLFGASNLALIGTGLVVGGVMFRRTASSVLASAYRNFDGVEVRALWRRNKSLAPASWL